jgi:hypothetical protein
MRNGVLPGIVVCATMCLSHSSLAQPTIDSPRVDSIYVIPNTPLPLTVTVDSNYVPFGGYPVLLEAVPGGSYNFMWPQYPVTSVYTITVNTQFPETEQTIINPDVELGAEAKASPLPKKIPSRQGIAGFGTMFSSFNSERD